MGRTRGTSTGSGAVTGCVEHPGSGIAGTCRRCERSFCGACLVYAFGVGVAPYCLDCALTHLASERTAGPDRVTALPTPA